MINNAAFWNNTNIEELLFVCSEDETSNWMCKLPFSGRMLVICYAMWTLAVAQIYTLLLNKQYYFNGISSTTQESNTRGDLTCKTAMFWWANIISLSVHFCNYAARSLPHTVYCHGNFNFFFFIPTVIWKPSAQINGQCILIVRSSLTGKLVSYNNHICANMWEFPCRWRKELSLTTNLERGLKFEQDWLAEEDLPGFEAETTDYILCQLNIFARSGSFYCEREKKQDW